MDVGEVLRLVKASSQVIGVRSESVSRGWRGQRSQGGVRIGLWQRGIAWEQGSRCIFGGCCGVAFDDETDDAGDDDEADGGE